MRKRLCHSPSACSSLFLIAILGFLFFLPPVPMLRNHLAIRSPFARPKKSIQHLAQRTIQKLQRGILSADPAVRLPATAALTGADASNPHRPWLLLLFGGEGRDEVGQKLTLSLHRNRAAHTG
jgi:hypothetical protein